MSAISKNKKLTAAAVCIAVVFALLFSIGYITTEAGHERMGIECTVIDCPICRVIETCVLILKIFGTAALFIVLFSAGFDIFMYKSSMNYHGRTADTLITLKVKLTD